MGARDQAPQELSALIFVLFGVMAHCPSSVYGFGAASRCLRRSRESLRRHGWWRSPAAAASASLSSRPKVKRKYASEASLRLLALDQKAYVEGRCRDAIASPSTYGVAVESTGASEHSPSPGRGSLFVRKRPRPSKASVTKPNGWIWSLCSRRNLAQLRDRGLRFSRAVKTALELARLRGIAGAS